MEPVLLLQKLYDSIMFENNEGKTLLEQLVSPTRTGDMFLELDTDLWGFVH